MKERFGNIEEEEGGYLRAVRVQAYIYKENEYAESPIRNS